MKNLYNTAFIFILTILLHSNLATLTFEDGSKRRIFAAAVRIGALCPNGNDSNFLFHNNKLEATNLIKNLPKQNINLIRQLMEDVFNKENNDNAKIPAWAPLNVRLPLLLVQFERFSKVQGDLPNPEFDYNENVELIMEALKRVSN